MDGALEAEKKGLPALALATASTLGLPVLVPVLCTAVEALGGFDQEGIFRISAEQSELKALQDQVRVSSESNFSIFQRCIANI